MLKKNKSSQELNNLHNNIPDISIGSLALDAEQKSEILPLNHQRMLAELASLASVEKSHGTDLQLGILLSKQTNLKVMRSMVKRSEKSIEASSAKHQSKQQIFFDFPTSEGSPGTNPISQPVAVKRKLGLKF